MQLEKAKTMGHKHTTMRQKIEICKFLDEVLERHEDGTCSYKDGFSDAEVTTRLAIGPKNAVAGIRFQMYGKLKIKVNPIVLSADKAEKLKNHLNSLCKQLGYSELEW